MATRPIFLPSSDTRLVRQEDVEFEWHPGFAASQKRRSIEALHRAAENAGLGHSFLEVSTRSADALGVGLSAFNLQIKLGDRVQPVSVEAAFQSSKVFSQSGRQEHLLDVADGRKIKTRIKELDGEALVGFELQGEPWPLTPPTAFYDSLYLTALTDLISTQREIEQKLLAIDAFTDIEFNPAKSLNCQARTCALFVSLGGFERVRDIIEDRESFIAILDGAEYGPPSPRNVADDPPTLF
jgi:hypothetical protein